MGGSLLSLLTDTQPKKVRKVPPGLPSSVSCGMQLRPHSPHASCPPGLGAVPAGDYTVCLWGTGLCMLLQPEHVDPRGRLSVGMWVLLPPRTQL